MISCRKVKQTLISCRKVKLYSEVASADHVVIRSVCECEDCAGAHFCCEVIRDEVQVPGLKKVQDAVMETDHAFAMRVRDEMDQQWNIIKNMERLLSQHKAEVREGEHNGEKKE